MKTKEKKSRWIYETVLTRIAYFDYRASRAFCFFFLLTYFFLNNFVLKPLHEYSTFPEKYAFEPWKKDESLRGNETKKKNLTKYTKTLCEIYFQDKNIKMDRSWFLQPLKKKVRIRWWRLGKYMARKERFGEVEITSRYTSERRKTGISSQDHTSLI